MPNAATATESTKSRKKMMNEIISLTIRQRMRKQVKQTAVTDPTCKDCGIQEKLPAKRNELFPKPAQFLYSV